MDALFLALSLSCYISLSHISISISPSFSTISLFPALAIPASSRTHNPAHLVHISFIPSSCFLLPSDSVSNPQLRLCSCSSFLQFFGYFGTLRTSFPLRCNWRINLPACFSLLSLFPIPVCAFCLSCFSQGIPGAEKRRTGFGFGIGSGTLLLQYSCNNFNFNFNIYFLGPVRARRTIVGCAIQIVCHGNLTRWFLISLFPSLLLIPHSLLSPPLLLLLHVSLFFQLIRLPRYGH